jgi:hypothetical protein
VSEICESCGKPIENFHACGLRFERYETPEVKALRDRVKELEEALDMVLVYLDDEHVGWEDNPFGADDVMRVVIRCFPDNPRAVELRKIYDRAALPSQHLSSPDHAARNED